MSARVQRAAKSIADMVTEYVEGGNNWRNGLEGIIEKRLSRFFLAEQGEPVFWYRPVGEDGGYEGPHHNSSDQGKQLRALKPAQWIPLFTQTQADIFREEVRTVMEKITGALEILSGAVFNDNGDMTVSPPVVSYEQCVSAYFATRAAHGLLNRLSAKEDGTHRKFTLGDRVSKIKGSSWNGSVVGFYSTTLTLVGYVVESEREPGSCQIYPESALEAAE